MASLSCKLTNISHIYYSRKRMGKFECDDQIKPGSILRFPLPDLEDIEM
ncbi:hypothetical protein COLO4_06646 [Corchorus olitorius]|uniref:Uncharacterized protein n=1 Tax=Corchorus olitorius TaxID=93759 RepID=A0A1R3KMC8_9ROSI|nr:hypothetical protein COLO4_06646 [Corchorus olitorius]